MKKNVFFSWGGGGGATVLLPGFCFFFGSVLLAVVLFFFCLWWVTCPFRGPLTDQCKRRANVVRTKSCIEGEGEAWPVDTETVPWQVPAEQ